jgi:hypothetical protein
MPGAAQRSSSKTPLETRLLADSLRRRKGSTERLAIVSRLYKIVIAFNL